MREEPSPEGSIARPGPASVHDRSSRWFVAAAVTILLLSLALVYARSLAFEPVIRVAAGFLSPDGVVSAAGRDSFAAFLLHSALAAAVVGTFIMACANLRVRRAFATMIGWDALRIRGLAVPNAYGVLISSSCFGVFAVGLWMLRGRLGEEIIALFAKEGPLEYLTFVLELVAAALCGVAALYWRRSHDRKSGHVIPALYGLCALVLFLVAMEEISWGQTIFGFDTPPAWAEINHQGETSLHNLFDKEALNAATRGVAIAFGAAVLLLIAIGMRWPGSVAGAVAPPPSLAGLASIAVYSGLRLHPELMEVLLAAFFAFYGYRIYVAARSSADSRPSVFSPKPLIAGEAALADPDVPLAGADTRSQDDRRLSDTELLEYTHDAIIIWEMGGRGIRYWNRAAEQLYGYGRREAYGRMTHELLKTELAGGVHLLERTVARFGIWVGELRHTTRDGRRVDVQGRLALMSQQNGRWLVLEVNRDITDRKAAEVARQSLQHQLTQLRRLRRTRIEV